MPRYIDADSLCERLEKRCCEITKYCGGPEIKQYMAGFREAFNALKNEPMADVQEVKPAKWAHYGEYVQCSSCAYITDDICYEGDMASGYYTVLPHYCSNCGAKMDLED